MNTDVFCENKDTSCITKTGLWGHFEVTGGPCDAWDCIHEPNLIGMRRIARKIDCERGNVHSLPAVFRNAPSKNASLESGNV